MRGLTRRALGRHNVEIARSLFDLHTEWPLCLIQSLRRAYGNRVTIHGPDPAIDRMVVAPPDSHFALDGAGVLLASRLLHEGGRQNRSCRARSQGDGVC